MTTYQAPVQHQVPSHCDHGCQEQPAPTNHTGVSQPGIGIGVTNNVGSQADSNSNSQANSENNNQNVAVNKVENVGNSNSNSSNSLLINNRSQSITFNNPGTFANLGNGIGYSTSNLNIDYSNVGGEDIYRVGVQIPLGGGKAARKALSFNQTMETNKFCADLISKGISWSNDELEPQCSNFSQVKTEVVPVGDRSEEITYIKNQLKEIREANAELRGQIKQMSAIRSMKRIGG